MKSNLPRFWTPRTGGLLTLLGLAVVTVGATLWGESLIGRNSFPQQALPGPKLTLAPMFIGLQGRSPARVPKYSVRRTKKVEQRPYPVAVAVATPAPALAPPAAPPVVALVERPAPAAPIAAAPVSAVAPIRRHHHKRVAPVAVAQVRANANAPLPTARPLPPRALMPVTTMTAPPPASIQLVPVPTITAAPPASVPPSPIQPTPVQTVTAASPRT
jgi:hypothetical protein